MRPTLCMEVLDKASKSIGKRIALWSCANGMTAFVRTEDGQAYQLDIKPACLADFEPFIKHYTKTHRWTVGGKKQQL